MGFEINEQYYVDIKIGKTVSPFSVFQTFQNQIVNSIDINLTNLKSLTLVESINQITPTFTLQYDASTPVLQENYPITTMEPFIVSSGKSLEDEDFRSENYYIMSSEPDTTEIRDGLNQNLILKGHFYPIKFMLSGDRASYKGTISDVMNEIVNQINRDIDTKIDPTHPDQNKQWIQPGWSYGKMMNYLRKRAVSSNKNMSDYVCCFRSDGKFLFKTVDSLMSQDIQDDSTARFVYARLSGKQRTGTLDQGDGRIERNKNTVQVLEWEHNSITPSRRGLIGHESAGINWEQSKYTEDKKDMIDIDQHNALTTRLLYNKERSALGHFSTEREGHYNGFVPSSKIVEGLTNRKVIEQNRKVSKMLVTTPSNTDLHIGQVAKLDMYDADVPGGRQNVLSGRWLVSDRIRHIDGKGEYTQKYGLIRTGINEASTAGQGFVQDRFASAD